MRSFVGERTAVSAECGWTTTRTPPTEWLASLERGDVRDWAIAGAVPYNWQLSKNDLKTRTALGWVADIDQTDLRRSVLAGLVGDDVLRRKSVERDNAEGILREAGVLEEDILAIRVSSADDLDSDNAPFE